LDVQTAFEDTFPGLEVIRFIDVLEKRLVETRQLVHYAALSYMWGTVPNFQLTTANKKRLLHPGAIQDVFSMFPQTIRDAISLTERLKIRYLWVDAICLVQNDPEDVRRGVQVMDQVYKRSYLTIIAACGYNASAGLPGMKPFSRKGSRIAFPITPNIKMGAYTDLKQLVPCTLYSIRGWT
jgi:hypothetical protein